MFINDLVPDPKWEPIPQIEKSTIAQGGLGGAANAQAQAILNNIEKTKKHTTLVFGSLVEAQSAAATLPEGSALIVKMDVSAGGRRRNRHIERLPDLSYQ